MGRPAVLDEVKKSENCALVTAGMSMRQIARYVGCDRGTIYRTRRREPQFAQRLRRAKMAGELDPLQAMRRAARTHWRAAAWMIERQDRQEADRRAARRAVRDKASQDQLEQLATDVNRVVEKAVWLPEQAPALHREIEALFDDHTAGRRATRPAPAATMDPSVEKSIQWLTAHYRERDNNRPEPELEPEPEADHFVQDALLKMAAALREPAPRANATSATPPVAQSTDADPDEDAKSPDS